MQICPRCDFTEFTMVINGAVFDLIMEEDGEGAEYTFTNRIRRDNDASFVIKYECKNCGHTEYIHDPEEIEMEEEID